MEEEKNYLNMFTLKPLFYFNHTTKAISVTLPVDINTDSAIA